MNEKSDQSEIRMQLVGTPEEIAPHIVRVAQEFEVQDLKYYAQEESYKSNRFSKQFRIMCGSYFGPRIVWLGEEPPKDLPHDIGVITLQSLPNNKTIFMGKRVSSSFDTEGSYFSSFLKKLFLELRQLGFVETLPKKLWRVVKELVGIAKAVKP